ncbi:hypothetical protein AAZV13_15G205300 [Glycine max]
MLRHYTCVSFSTFFHQKLYQLCEERDVKSETFANLISPFLYKKSVIYCISYGVLVLLI